MNRYVLGLLAVFAVGVSGTLALNKTKSTATTPSEVVQINNHTVTGNITEDRKSKDQSSLVNDKKSILRLNVDKKRVVYFTDTFNRQSVARAVKELKRLDAESSSERITLAIESPGGSVIDGAELTSQMEASKAPVDTVCLKLCASMAAIAHSYGAKRYALDRAILMYHPATAGVQGQVPNMLSLLTTLTRYIDKFNANIINRSKMNKDEFDRLVAYELWIDSEDALNKGLIDNIVSINIAHEDESSSYPSEHEEGEYEEEEMGVPVGPRVEFTSISPYAKDLW